MRSQDDLIPLLADRFDSVVNGSPLCLAGLRIRRLLPYHAFMRSARPVEMPKLLAGWSRDADLNSLSDSEVAGRLGGCRAWRGCAPVRT